MHKSIYIAYAKRTAIGSLLSNFANVPAHKLGSALIKSCIAQHNFITPAIDEVILGQVLTGGCGQNPARQSVIRAGLPEKVPAFTVNQVCGSGLKAVMLAALSIANEEANIIIAGGQENMSLAMHGMYIRSRHKFGNTTMTDLMQHDGLTDVFSGTSMGITAENIAKQFNISRSMQDEFAYYSQQKAANANEAGMFNDEILPIEITKNKQNIIINKDEGIRAGTTLEKLQRLLPAFDKDGSVTAGNSSTINDGAAILMIVSEDALKQYNLKPLVRIVSYGQAGVNPSIMGTGPVPASHIALHKANWNVKDLDLIECNEAFAAQAIYVNQQMKWDLNKVNVNGGAIALGHPIGASGARILVTLIHQMKRTAAKKGLATLCIGGGMGVAMCIANV